jgi:2,3-diketo-5-methylthio-1-phosphopentane phosphatase/methylthioribulose-1-phosphate dehydratase
MRDTLTQAQAQAQAHAHAHHLPEAPQEALAALGRWIDLRGWCPAPSGNLSARLSDHSALITASGHHKGALSPEHLIEVPLRGPLPSAVGGERPSAETLVHRALYTLSPHIGAVLHTHSLAATALSRLTPGETLRLEGLEMQKSLAGVTGHEAPIELPIFPNTQDMEALAREVEARWRAGEAAGRGGLAWGLLVRGHGLYAWGRTLAEARRHLEGLEFLMACALEERRARPSRGPLEGCVILTDIEGTTTAIDFVHKTLFPYAAAHMSAFVEAHHARPDVSPHIDEARALLSLPPEAPRARVVEGLLRWIAEDKKLTPLKALQGLIWEEGYRAGALKGHLYPDAFAALCEWRARGAHLAVFSSGSVRAQRLLFERSDFGDLTPYLSAYFDTTTGPKREGRSYELIVASLVASGLAAGAAQVLFLSDIAEELDAARAAGLSTREVRRDGVGPSGRHEWVASLAEVRWRG